MKVKNSDLLRLLKVYSKFVTATLEEEFFDDGYELAKDAVLIEDALKAYSKLEEKLKNSIDNTEESKRLEMLEKANKELNSALEKEVEVKEFFKISKDFIFKNKIKLTPMEIKAIKDFKIID